MNVSEETRGRPKGVKNGQGTSVVAPIKKWKPKHDLVVQLHIACYSNDEIATMTKFSSVRVGQILGDPKAKNMIRAAQERLREKLSKEIDEGLVAICAKAVQNIRETIEIDGLTAGTDFKRHQDKISLEVLKGRGFLSKDGGDSKTRNETLPLDLLSKVNEALMKSEEVTAYMQEREEKEQANEIMVGDDEVEIPEGKFVLVSKNG